MSNNKAEISFFILNVYFLNDNNNKLSKTKGEVRILSVPEDFSFLIFKS